VSVRIINEFTTPVTLLSGWNNTYYSYGTTQIGFGMHKVTSDIDNYTTSVLRGTLCSSNDTILSSINATCSLSSAPIKSLNAVATVEGSSSTQTFSTTTWNGDGTSQVFEFNLYEPASHIDEEYQQYLKLKQKYG
jgi:hypothetical protein